MLFLKNQATNLDFSSFLLNKGPGACWPVFFLATSFGLIKIISSYKQLLPWLYSQITAVTITIKKEDENQGSEAQVCHGQQQTAVCKGKKRQKKQIHPQGTEGGTVRACPQPTASTPPFPEQAAGGL